MNNKYRKLAKKALSFLALVLALPALAQTGLTNMSNHRWTLTFSERPEDMELLGVEEPGYIPTRIDVHDGHSFIVRLSRDTETCLGWYAIDPGETVQLSLPDRGKPGLAEYLTLQDSNGIQGVLDLRLTRTPNLNPGWMGWLGWGPQGADQELSWDTVVGDAAYRGDQICALRENPFASFRGPSLCQLIQRKVFRDNAGNLFIAGDDWPTILGNALAR